jgi:hypothetical protein
MSHGSTSTKILRLPLKLNIFRGQTLIARHPRSYGHNQDIENPDHLSRLLEERKRAEDAALLARFLALSPKAEAYYGALRQRELHAMGHVRRIHLLVVDKDGLEFDAFEIRADRNQGQWTSSKIFSAIEFQGGPEEPISPVL